MTLEVKEIENLKNMRNVKEALIKKFTPMLNRIHFLDKSKNLIEDQMNIQIKIKEQPPLVNPCSGDLSDQLLHSITQLNELNYKKQSL